VGLPSIGKTAQFLDEYKKLLRAHTELTDWAEELLDEYKKLLRAHTELTDWAEELLEKVIGLRTDVERLRDENTALRSAADQPSAGVLALRHESAVEGQRIRAAGNGQAERAA
jgi:molybdenum-dependent DNA-binding transcriptional regulator ModE